MPHHWIASQIEGSPNASPAWMVKWKFSRRRYSNASRCRVGGNPGLGAGDVESDDAPVAVGDGQLGDLARAGGVAHRGRQRADPDDVAPLGSGGLAGAEPGEDGVHDLLEAQPAVGVLFGRPAHLGVDDPVVGEVLGALAGDPFDARPSSA